MPRKTASKLENTELNEIEKPVVEKKQQLESLQLQNQLVRLRRPLWKKKKKQNLVQKQ